MVVIVKERKHLDFYQLQAGSRFYSRNPSMACSYQAGMQCKQWSRFLAMLISEGLAYVAHRMMEELTPS